MEERFLPFIIQPQPNDTTCGPTCLQAVYQYYGDLISLNKVISEVKQFKSGGTLAVQLGNHALSRGYRATIYTYNLHIFDPSWFKKKVNLSEKLTQQIEVKNLKKMKFATDAYLKFLKNGGSLRFEELTPKLIKSFLINGIPILTGLSATYLYKSPREIGETNTYHDILGKPAGHFVIVHGYNKKNRKVYIADPLHPNPMNKVNQYYAVNINRLINAIMLGIITYDANLLIIESNQQKNA